MTPKTCPKCGGAGHYTVPFVGGNNPEATTINIGCLTCWRTGQVVA